MKILTQIVILILIAGCASKELRAEREFEKRSHVAMIDAFKIQSFCSCYRHAFEKIEITKLMWQEDAMGSLDMIAGEKNSALIDSLGKSEAAKIRYIDYNDLRGKRPITAHCLEFYTSKRLDSIARVKFKFTKDAKLIFSD